MPWTQSQLLYEAVAEKENEVTLVKYERLGHSFFNNSNLDQDGVGPATTVTARDPRGTVSSSTSTVFALCEKFFRFYPVERERGFIVRFGASGL